MLSMNGPREELITQLEAHYRSNGWRVAAADDGTLVAEGPGGVSWLGAPVVTDDFASGDLEERLSELADRRMPGSGELCPLDLLPARECESDLRALLERLGLSRRPHVSLYSLA